MFILLRSDRDGVPDIALYGVQDWQLSENGRTTVWFPSSSEVDEEVEYDAYRPVAGQDGGSLYDIPEHLDEHISTRTRREDTVVRVVPSVRYTQLYEYEDIGNNKWASL